MNLVSVRLITDDIKRLVSFYEGVTGLTATWSTEDFAELKMPAFTLAIGSTRTMALFGMLPAGGGDRGRNIVEFRVADVDGEYQKVRGLIQEVVQTPTTMPWGNRSLLFRDPDGNLVNFFAPVTAAAIKRLDG